MSKLTKEFLDSLGVNMDDQTFDKFSEHFDETLLHRVEMRVVDNLTTEQIRDFRTMRDSGHESIWIWLQSNVSHLDEIIRTEVDAILSEVVQNSSDL